MGRLSTGHWRWHRSTFRYVHCASTCLFFKSAKYLKVTAKKKSSLFGKSNEIWAVFLRIPHFSTTADSFPGEARSNQTSCARFLNSIRLIWDYFIAKYNEWRSKWACSYCHPASLWPWEKRLITSTAVTLLIANDSRCHLPEANHTLTHFV